MQESPVAKSRLTDKDITEYAVKLFLGALPKLDEQEEEKPDPEKHNENLQIREERHMPTEEQKPLWSVEEIEELFERGAVREGNELETPVGGEGATENTETINSPIPKAL